MAITLRVVGTFYQNENIAVPSGSTVKDVLDYAQANPTGTSTSSSTNAFGYSVNMASGGSSVMSFSVTYDQCFNSITSGMAYPAGTYFLAENMQSSPVYSVWQFYVQDADGKPVAYNPRITFFDQPNAVVPDNGTVTWRLVNLLTGPNVAPKPAQQRLS